MKLNLQLSLIQLDRQGHGICFLRDNNLCLYSIRLTTNNFEIKNTVRSGKTRTYTSYRSLLNCNYNFKSQKLKIFCIDFIVTCKGYETLRRAYLPGCSGFVLLFLDTVQPTRLDYRLISAEVRNLYEVLLFNSYWTPVCS